MGSRATKMRLLAATGMCIVSSAALAQDYGLQSTDSTPINNPSGTTLQGAKTGILSTGSQLNLDNAGTIRGDGTAVTGRIADAGILVTGGPAAITNSAATGLPANCQVLSGIHDSNASLMRYLGKDGAGTVLSTGTWMIAAAFGAPLERLVEEKDMLANTNALGRPVACMRFMGGREFGALAGAELETCTLEDIERLIARGTMALPCFAETGGPFAGQPGRIEGKTPQDARERYALATLYCVLVTDYCLDALQAAGPLAVEGSFTANPWFGPLLAALRPQQPLTYSDDASGTTCGGWMLRYRDANPPAGGRSIAALPPAGLTEYRQRWLAALA